MQFNSFDDDGFAPTAQGDDSHIWDWDVYAVVGAALIIGLGIVGVLTVL